MIELPTCVGCYISPNWPYIFPSIPFTPIPSYPQVNFEPIPQITPMFVPTQPFVEGLTSDEQEILNYLANAYRLFVKLDAKHPDDDNEFREAIHAAQKMIALRVARRVDPQIWYQPGDSPLVG
jgi:hypothetical protein